MKSTAVMTLVGHILVVLAFFMDMVPDIMITTTPTMLERLEDQQMPSGTTFLEHKTNLQSTKIRLEARRITHHIFSDALVLCIFSDV
eukprot:m.16760 g.16760  ORF g.16760 m.16760 type:complete len:87 (-) comp8042_c0_seq1:158-418(-)